MSDQKINIIELIIATTALILLLSGFIITMLTLYQKKQFDFQRNIEEMKLGHEKNILQAQLEIQEQTLQHVSREIHDNIALGLTLSKLHLNTLNFAAADHCRQKVSLSVDLITEAIRHLNNISKSLGADIIERHGLLKAVENEIANLDRTGMFRIDFRVTGTPVFLNARTELVLFRIMQESLNNIIKHSRATEIGLRLNYDDTQLLLTVEDNGVGFALSAGETPQDGLPGSGLGNIRHRARLINSCCCIHSTAGKGTVITVAVPMPPTDENEHHG